MMLDFANIEDIKINESTHLVIFDTGVVKTLFRQKNRDCVKEFADIYYAKFKTKNYHALTTPSSLLELLGIANKIPKLIYSLPVKNFSDPKKFYDYNVEKFEEFLKKYLTRTFLTKAYFNELNYSANARGVKLFLKNGNETYLCCSSRRKSFISMLAENFLLSNDSFRKKIEVETVSHNDFLRDLCFHIYKRNPNQSLGYLFFSLYSNNEVNKEKIEQQLNISSIKFHPFQELLDFEIIHFLVLGYIHQDKLNLPVIFVTTESNYEKWRERISLYSGVIRHLGIPVTDQCTILTISQDKPNKHAWANFNKPIDKN